MGLPAALLTDHGAFGLRSPGRTAGSTTGQVGAPTHGWRQSHQRPEGVVQDFDAFQEPPPIDLPAAWIFQVPDMDLPATEPA